MAQKLNSFKTGLALGGALGSFHFVWALLIAIGIAQPLMDFIFEMHMIKPVYLIMPFSLTHAATLILFTASLGFLVGYLFAAFWNFVSKK